MAWSLGLLELGAVGAGSVGKKKAKTLTIRRLPNPIHELP